MIHLITGGVNQGKSTRLLNIYQTLGKGDGFYNRRVYQGITLIGQEIIHLATGQRYMLAFREEHIPEGWNEECRLGPFSFSREGWEFGRQIIESGLENQVSPSFLDEIGPLELAGRGWDAILRRVLLTAPELFIVVRDSCIMEMIRKYRLQEYEIVGR